MFVQRPNTMLHQSFVRLQPSSIPKVCGCHVGNYFYNGVCVAASNYSHALYKVAVTNGAEQYGTPTTCNLMFTEQVQVPVSAPFKICFI